MRNARASAAGVAALACAAALAQDPDPPGRRAFEQKEALVRRLVFDSPAEQRIAASGIAEAIAELARARALHARALALAQAGDVAGAQAELDSAMWSVGKARRLAPDSPSRALDQRVRYAALLGTVESLARSYASHASRLEGETGAAAHARLASAAASQEEARGRAATEQFDEAVRFLARAERELLTGLNALLGAATIEYARRFETPGEEYAFELERNRSYRELIPVAIAEFKPRREAAALVERYVAANARQLEAAQGHAGAGRTAAAIEALRTGTVALQSALAAAGLALPRDTGGN